MSLSFHKQLLSRCSLIASRQGSGTREFSSPAQSSVDQWMEHQLDFVCDPPFAQLPIRLFFNSFWWISNRCAINLIAESSSAISSPSSQADSHSNTQWNHWLMGETFSEDLPLLRESSLANNCFASNCSNSDEQRAAAPSVGHKW